MANGFTRWWRERRRVRAIRAASAASQVQTLVAAAQALPERPRILLLKLDHIGDLVLAMRAMLQIRKAWPDAHITLVCGPWNVALARQFGLFDRLVAYRFFSDASPGAQPAAPDRHAEFAALDLGEPFDLAIDMRYDQDTRPLLDAIDARFRAGYSARNLKTALNLELPTTEQASRGDRSLLPIPAETRLIMLASAVVEVFGRPQTHPIHDVAAAVVDAGSPRGRYIVISTGARKTTSKWPIANFVALCAALAEQHSDEIVVIGDGTTPRTAVRSLKLCRRAASATRRDRCRSKIFPRCCRRHPCTSATTPARPTSRQSSAFRRSAFFPAPAIIGCGNRSAPTCGPCESQSAARPATWPTGKNAPSTSNACG